MRGGDLPILYFLHQHKFTRLRELQSERGSAAAGILEFNGVTDLVATAAVGDARHLRIAVRVDFDRRKQSGPAT